MRKDVGSTIGTTTRVYPSTLRSKVNRYEIYQTRTGQQWFVWDHKLSRKIGGVYSIYRMALVRFLRVAR